MFVFYHFALILSINPHDSLPSPQYLSVIHVGPSPFPINGATCFTCLTISCVINLIYNNAFLKPIVNF